MVQENTRGMLKPVAGLIDDLAGQDIYISLAGDRLKITGNRDAITRELKEQLKERKDEITNYLRAVEEEKDIIAIEEQEHYPLSHAQQRLWVISQFPEVGAAYNLFQVQTIPDQVNPNLFRKSMLHLVERHESLRTVFIVQQGVPRQRVCTAAQAEPDVVHKELGASANAEAEAAEYLNNCVLSPFNLSTGPLVRACILKMPDGETVYAIAIHHIVSDGWSMEVFHREMIACYQALETNSPVARTALPVQYRDFAVWQNKRLRQKNSSRHKDYWMRELGGELPVIDLAWEKQRPPSKTYNGASAQCLIPESTVARLRVIAEENGATMFMMMAAAFSILLARYTGQYDVILGTPGAGRDQTALEQQIGFYVNTLPIRTRFTPDNSFMQVLNAAKRASLGAFANQLYPFDKMVEDLSPERKANFSPVFDIMMSFLDHLGFGAKTPDAAEAPANVKGVDFNKGTSQFDLSVFFFQQQNFMVAKFEYNTDILTIRQVNSFCTHFITLLRAITENSGLPVHSLPVFNEEIPGVLQLGEGKFTGLVLPLVCSGQKSNGHFADRAALVSDNREYSHLDMWHYADRVSGYLLHHLQIKKGDKIALLMQPTAEFVLLLMGILQTGGVCVPVHPGAAGEQLEEVVKNIGCVAIFFEGTPLTNGGREVWVNINVALEFTTTAQNLPLPAGMDTACCLYTNNAYNRGVLVTHEAIANGACWLCEEIYQSGRLNILADGSLNQIASLQQIFAALHCGATLVFIPQEIRHNPGQMLEALMRHRVNALLATPPMLQALLAQTQNKEALPPLQFVFTAGKWLSPSLVHLCHNRFPEAQLINIYINATCGIAAAEITPPSGWKAGSAGKPVYNTRITLRDRESGILPLCVTGELCIGGNAMAAGYEGKPALSKEKFPTDKAGKKYFKTGEFFRWRRDGQLEYSLQKDKRVKIKGHHISLAEVSWSILNLPGITCLLITVPEAEDRKSMALYYTGTLLPRELEKALRSRLPPYMIPETVLHLNEFPLSPDGAININALPQLKINNTTTLQQPADETEQVVMKIWQQALKTEQINGTDNFFAIGGHSLKAFQVLSRVNEYFGIKLMLNDIFLNPTVIDLAAMIKQSARVTVTVQMPPLEEQAWYRADARQMRVFGRIQFALHPRPYNITRNFSLSRVSRQIFERVINLLLCRHEALRTGFIYREGQLYQRVMDIRHISSPVEYYDFSGLTGRDQLLEKLFNEYGNKLFDFSEAPLWRIALVQMNDNLDVVIICMQHIISDGPSVQLLFDEFNECYMLLENGMAPPPPPELQLKDYCAWQQRILEKEGPKRLAYWRQKLTPDMLNYQAFPGQQGREKGYHKSMNQELAIHGNTFARNNPEYVYGNMAMARPYHGNMYSVLLPLDSWEQLQKITRELGCGYFSLLAAAMGVWMYRQTANQALVLVCPVSYRQEPPWQFITGYLVELMPLPLRLDVEGSFIAAVNAATQSFTEARQNLYPFEQLLHRLNHSIHAAGYLMLHLRNIDSTRDIEFPAEKQCRHENDFYVQCQMDVELDVYKNGLAMHFEYWPDMFSPAEAEFFAHGFSGLLQQLLANPEKKLIEY